MAQRDPQGYQLSSEPQQTVSKTTARRGANMLAPHQIEREGTALQEKTCGGHLYMDFPNNIPILRLH